MPSRKQPSPTCFDPLLLEAGVVPTRTYIQGQVAGSFSVVPKGCILHGSRSGRDQSTHDEFVGTANWAANNPDGLSWNCTIGDDEFCQHLGNAQWGHNARAASNDYLAVEFAQPTVDHPISDAQVHAFCYWWKEVELRWPEIERGFWTHAELEDWGQTGQQDGKSDVFPTGDPRTDDLRARILAGLG